MSDSSRDPSNRPVNPPRDRGGYWTGPHQVLMLTGADVEGGSANDDLSSHPLLPDLSIDTFELSGVASFVEAREVLAAKRIEAILLELDLAAADAMPRLLRVLAAAREVPVIVLSAGADEQRRKAAIAAGAEDVLTDPDGDNRLLSSFVLNVIHRDRAREHHQHVEGLINATPDAILVVSQAGVVRYVNRAAEQLFGRKRADFVGELLSFSVKDGEPSEIAIRRGDEVCLGEMRVVEFDWHDERAHLATIRDITQQRKLDTQLLMSDRLISLGTLAAGIAHEVNNPLAAILANLAIALEETAEDDPRRSELSDARDAALQIRHVIRDIGVFARTNEDRCTVFDVHDTLDSVARMARGPLRESAQLLKDYGEIARVYGDASGLSQVFLNLLVNAAQAIQPGHPEQNRITITSRMTDGGRVAISIRDTGCGMTPAVRRRIFTPFFTTKPVGTGTGLGLAISQKIVDSFGGQILVEAEPGVGSCFTVVLPAAQVASSEVSSPRNSMTVRRRTPSGRVMVVDDDAIVSNAIVRTLCSEHEVTSFGRSVEALAAIKSGEPFDVILCDLMMPELDGIGFCRALEELGQADGLVFISGGAAVPHVGEFLAQCKYPCVAKPFKVEELRAVVAEVLGARRRSSSRERDFEGPTLRWLPGVGAHREDR